MNGVVLDVTENILLEKKNIELAKESNEKTKFLSNMSHDIRTPMNAIINLTRMARDDYNGIGKGDVLEDLDKLESASDFLLGLINDILDMSRIESGKMTLNPEVYTYREFLNYIECIFAPLCEKRNINFIWEKGSTDVCLYVDKVRFNQLFFNLISNAVKYTEDGGNVGFKVYNNKIHDGKLTCSFKISDTGRGISEEFQKKMFLPFEREEDSSRKVEGTGLGLAIVKNIVELINGEMSYESKKGVGTIFDIKLTLDIATDEQLRKYEINNKLTSDSSSLTNKRILVVQDNIMNIIIIKNILEKQHIDIIEASNGEEAVEIFKNCDEDSIDAILMDIRMPVMDGLKATVHIRNSEKSDGKNIPILAMTANAFEEDRKSSREAGMTDYLTKPVNPALLIRTLKKLLADASN